MRGLWIACAIACSVPQDAPEPPTELEGPAPHEATEHSAREATDGLSLDPDTACGRALACCRAFAEATPNVLAEHACVGPAEASTADDADERCARMTEGWRVALERNPDVEPPGACSAPGE